MGDWFDDHMHNMDRHMQEMRHLDEIDAKNKRHWQEMDAQDQQHHDEMMKLIDEYNTVRKAYNELGDAYDHLLDSRDALAATRDACYSIIKECQEGRLEPGFSPDYVNDRIQEYTEARKAKKNMPQNTHQQDSAASATKA